MKTLKALLGIVAVSVLWISPAMALSMTGGTVDDWGITPFSDWVPDGEIGWWAEGDDYSPIDFPLGIGNLPSPGGPRGEGFDIEWLGWKCDGTDLQVLSVASFGIGNEGYRRGDLFLDVNNDGVWEKAIVSVDHYGLTAGYMYDVDDLEPFLGIWTQPGFEDIIDQASPFAVADGDLLGMGSIDKAVYDYGGDEDGTDLWQYNISLSDLGVTSCEDLAKLRLHLTIKCANDLIETPIPEPATMAMCGAGFLGIFLARRRRNNK